MQQTTETNVNEGPGGLREALTKENGLRSGDCWTTMANQKHQALRLRMESAPTHKKCTTGKTISIARSATPVHKDLSGLDRDSH